MADVTILAITIASAVSALTIPPFAKNAKDGAFGFCGGGGPKAGSRVHKRALFMLIMLFMG
jgi:hypothetical protein